LSNVDKLKASEEAYTLIVDAQYWILDQADKDRESAKKIQFKIDKELEAFKSV
jgi:hypothetical protein